MAKPGLVLPRFYPNDAVNADRIDGHLSRMATQINGNLTAANLSPAVRFATGQFLESRSLFCSSTMVSLFSNTTPQFTVAGVLNAPFVLGGVNDVFRVFPVGFGMVALLPPSVALGQANLNFQVGLYNGVFSIQAVVDVTTSQTALQIKQPVVAGTPARIISTYRKIDPGIAKSTASQFFIQITSPSSVNGAICFCTVWLSSTHA